MRGIIGFGNWGWGMMEANEMILLTCISLSITALTVAFSALVLLWL